MFNLCVNCTYLSVSRRNAVGEISKIQPQLRSNCSVCNPIIYPVVYKQYHVIVSSEYAEKKYSVLAITGRPRQMNVALSNIEF